MNSNAIDENSPEYRTVARMVQQMHRSGQLPGPAQRWPLAQPMAPPQAMAPRPASAYSAYAASAGNAMHPAVRRPAPQGQPPRPGIPMASSAGINRQARYQNVGPMTRPRPPRLAGPISADLASSGGIIGNAINQFPYGNLHVPPAALSSNILSRRAAQRKAPPLESLASSFSVMSVDNSSGTSSPGSSQQVSQRPIVSAARLAAIQAALEPRKRGPIIGSYDLIKRCTVHELVSAWEKVALKIDKELNWWAMNMRSQRPRNELGMLDELLVAIMKASVRPTGSYKIIASQAEQERQTGHDLETCSTIINQKGDAVTYHDYIQPKPQQYTKNSAAGPVRSLYSTKDGTRQIAILMEHVAKMQCMIHRARVICTGWYGIMAEYNFIVAPVKLVEQLLQQWSEQQLIDFLTGHIDNFWPYRMQAWALLCHDENQKHYDDVCAALMREPRYDYVAASEKRRQRKAVLDNVAYDPVHLTDEFGGAVTATPLTPKPAPGILYDGHVLRYS